MKTAGRENPKRWAATSQQPSPWRGRSEQISFIQMGCEARKLPAAGEIFFLTSAFIEPPFWFAGFGTDRLRCEQAMKTAGRENPKRWAATSQQPSPWRGRSEQISFIQMACEARKLPAPGEIFFFTSAFIEPTFCFAGFA